MADEAGTAGSRLAHLDAVWARARAAVADDARTADLVVGVLRAAGPGQDEAGLLATVDRSLTRHEGAVITRLGAPEPVPALPAATRVRLQARVLAEHDATALAPPVVRSPGVGATLGAVAFLGLAAAVVAALVTGTPPAPSTPPDVAIAAPRVTVVDDASTARRQASVALAARGGVPPTGDLVLDRHLVRCAAAVRGSGRAEEYPDPAGWVLGPTERGRTGVTTSVSDTFFCATTPTATHVSSPGGATTGLAAAGPVRVVTVGPYFLGVLNPAGSTVVARQTRPPEISSSFRSPTRLLPTRGVAEAPFGLSLLVAEDTGIRYDGPVPDPGPTAITVREAVVADPDRTSPDGAVLQRCLSGPAAALLAGAEAWTPVLSSTRPDGSTLVLARARGMGGLCVVDGDTVTFVAAPVPEPPSSGHLATVARVRPDDAATAYLLLSVDPRATRMAASRGGDGLPCLVADALAVCLAAPANTGATMLTATDDGGATVAGPVRR